MTRARQNHPNMTTSTIPHKYDQKRKTRREQIHKRSQNHNNKTICHESNATRPREQ